MLVWCSITNPYGKVQHDVGVLGQVTGTGSPPQQGQPCLAMHGAGEQGATADTLTARHQHSEHQVYFRHHIQHVLTLKSYGLNQDPIAYLACLEGSFQG